MKSSGWPAPAKLNLLLRITGRRADGYHLLQTLFQFLDHSDTLHFTTRDDGVIRRTRPCLDLPEELDLTIRAARTLQEASGSTQGVEITLEKRLPLGGGLGGGSSDAATTLVALNRLWGVGFTPERLAALALSLGADVPVFVHGHASWAEGIGELLTPVEPPESWYLVVVPDVKISTAEIFNAPELTRDSPPIKIRALPPAGGENVCQPVVLRRYPVVAESLAWLQRYGRAMLTGTGSCVFAAFATAEQATEVLAEIPHRWRGFVARGKNRSPLLERLKCD